MIHQFAECGLGPRNPLPQNGKKLFWNVDFLLDLQSAEIVNIIAIRSPERLEGTFAVLLEHDADTQIIEKGLGANDAPRSTHLLRVNADEVGWVSFADSIQKNFSNRANIIN